MVALVRERGQAGRADEGARIVFGPGSTFEAPADITVRLKSASTLSGEGGDVQLAAGAELVVPAGTTVELTRRMEKSAAELASVRLEANWEIGVPSWSTLKNGDAELRWQGDDALRVKLAAALVLEVAPGAQARISIDSGEQQFQGDIHAVVPLAGGATLVGSIAAGAVAAYEAVDPAWDRSMLGRPDLGLQTVFADGSGCTVPRKRSSQTRTAGYVLVSRPTSSARKRNPERRPSTCGSRGRSRSWATASRCWRSRAVWSRPSTPSSRPRCSRPVLSRRKSPPIRQFRDDLPAGSYA